MKLKIKDFAEKYGLKTKQVYNLIEAQKKQKLAVKVPGLGKMIDEEKYLKLIA